MAQLVSLWTYDISPLDSIAVISLIKLLHQDRETLPGGRGVIELYSMQA